MKKQELINTAEALEILRNSWLSEHYAINRPSLLSWVDKYNLGFKKAGRFLIYKQKLIDWINDDGRKTKKK